MGVETQDLTDKLDKLEDERQSLVLAVASGDAAAQKKLAAVRGQMVEINQLIADRHEAADLMEQRRLQQEEAQRRKGARSHLNLAEAHLEQRLAAATAIDAALVELRDATEEYLTASREAHEHLYPVAIAIGRRPETETPGFQEYQLAQLVLQANLTRLFQASPALYNMNVAVRPDDLDAAIKGCAFAATVRERNTALTAGMAASLEA